MKERGQVGSWKRRRGREREMEEAQYFPLFIALLSERLNDSF